MEEPGTGNAGKRRNRLLKSSSRLFLCMMLGLCALQPAPAETAAANTQPPVLRKEDGYFFTSASCMYSVDIETAAPSSVTVYMNKIPEHVELLSIKKEAFVAASGGTGTHISVTVRFSRSGDYKLFPLDVQIGGNFRTIQFEKVHVYENIQNLTPRLSVEIQAPALSSGQQVIDVEAGGHIMFTLYVQYAVQVPGLSWTIPENSLFTEVRRYEIAGDAQFPEFSPEQRPVIQFDWQPLAAGTCSLPDIMLTAAAYNGARMELTCPQYTVHVNAAPRAAAKAPAAASTVQAAPPPAAAGTAPAIPLSDADLDTLLHLHSAERRQPPASFLLGRGAARERRAAEESFGIPQSSIGANLPLFFVFLGTAVLCAVLAGLLFAAKKIPAVMVCAALFAASAVCAVPCGLRLSRQYAVCRGGMLLPIPEKNASGLVAIQRGSVVRVQDNVGGWVYVSQQDASGWLSAADILPIQ